MYRPGADLVAMETAQAGVIRGHEKGDCDGMLTDADAGYKIKLKQTVELKIDSPNLSCMCIFYFTHLLKENDNKLV